MIYKAHIHVYIYIYTYIHIYIHIYIYTLHTLCTHTHIYIYIHMYTYFSYTSYILHNLCYILHALLLQSKMLANGRIALISDLWTPENDMLTAAMKLKRPLIAEKHKPGLTKMHSNSSAPVYEGMEGHLRA